MLERGRQRVVVHERPHDEGDNRTHFRAVRITTRVGEHLIMLVDPAASEGQA